MKAFEIRLNGKQLLVAGTTGQGNVLSTVVTWTSVSPPSPPSGEFHFHVGGVDGDTGEHVGWSVPKVGVGDEITIKIVESDRSDPENWRRTFPTPTPGETFEDFGKRVNSQGWGDEVSGSETP